MRFNLIYFKLISQTCIEAWYAAFILISQTPLFTGTSNSHKALMMSSRLLKIGTFLLAITDRGLVLPRSLTQALLIHEMRSNLAF